MDNSELKALADRVMTDRRFCSDETHRLLAAGYLALIAENERMLKLPTQWTEVYEQTADLEAAHAEIDQLKAEIDEDKLHFQAMGKAVEGLVAELNQVRAECKGLRNSLEALAESREALIAQGRNFALDEASHVCFRTAFAKYYPPGTRYKLFTPKINKAAGDALVEAANLIAELPDGPYWRHLEREKKKSEQAAMSKGERS